MSIAEIHEQTKTPAEIQAIRDRVVAIGSAEGLSRTQMSDQAGIPLGTFGQWLDGKYNGRNDNVAAKVEVWLTAREEQRAEAATVPQAPEFVDTKSARLFMQKLRAAQVMPDFVAIISSPGVGKTTSARQYRDTNPHVWLVTLHPYASSAYGMLNELAKTMGVVERSNAQLPGAIARKIQNTGGLLIFDEAQNLEPKAIDMIRWFYDQCGVGVALVGNEAILANVAGGSRPGGRAYFSQLSSRLGERVIRPRPYVDDIAALLDAWGVSDKKEADLLKQIAGKPGALREMTKVLVAATMLAAGAGEERGLRHIKAAWSRRASSGGEG